jgi:Transposase, Mutator family
MHDTAKVPRNLDGGKPAGRPLVDDELAGQLLGKAQAEGVELLGPDGLLSQVTKVVLERALAEEMTGHLGYDKHDPAGRGSGNSRNGTTPRRCSPTSGRWTWPGHAIATAASIRGSSARGRPGWPINQSSLSPLVAV